MDLYLVRHAIAEVRDPEAWPDDSERPLTDEGIRRFRKASRGLRKLVPSVDVVLSSPHSRAWNTAEILRDKAKWPAPQRCDALTGDDMEAIKIALEPYSGATSVALVGHEPHLSRLAATLLSTRSKGAPIEMKKGGVACFRIPEPESRFRGELRWLLPPGVLRALS